MQRIIFLDIDGPVINTPCYWVDSRASTQRAIMNTQSIGILNQLCKIAGAKIVTNSTHNTWPVRETGRSLKQDLVKWGIPETNFHETWRTSYPWPKDRIGATNRSRRMWGIQEWIDEHGECDWICFDDEVFTDDPRLFVIDFDRGIDYDVYLNVLKHWNKDKSHEHLLYRPGS